MTNHAHPHTDHITPIKVYLAIGLSLLVLTAVTVIVSKIHLGPWNAIVALAIASFKALLVALFFMHLLYDKKIYMVIVSISLVILATLIALTMADILSRGDIYDYQAGPITPEAKIYDPKTGLPLRHGHDEANEQVADTAAVSHESLQGDTLDINEKPHGGDSTTMEKNTDR
jgi:cytochrome c oxidase subunit 4